MKALWFVVILGISCISSPAQTATAVIKIDTDRVVREVDPHIFGNFAEHLGRCIYGGIFDEGNPLWDENGFRKDVMNAVAGLGVTGFGGRPATSPRATTDGWHRPARPATGPPRRRMGRVGIQPLRD